MKTAKEHYAERYGNPEGDNAQALSVHDYHEIIEVMESFAEERVIEFISDIVQTKSCTVFRDGDVKEVYTEWINQ